ncbi:hypothetical protein DR64_8139 [Paraburkholderia xenovorans LB400]|uniref:thiamine pyrophosphate-binding protein n=1 Tax=Paraburkholderia xenovorans TaxID=36873 RepID=UPI0002ED7156|nr:thiamine pyrophosphate-binding protein [Paraburkholderia xenovorans]AIP33961.1 hypothetical protein DR64_8139 [Paraburkholderia xenovorans LB400]
MKTVQVGRAIVNALRAEGVDALFGMPGGHVIQIYDALYDTPEIRHYLVRHEGTAASMAAGYAQLTGRPAVCVVTAGPGATNVLTAVAEAHVASLPMVIIAGRGATTTSYRGASQEVPTEKVFAPVTKWSVRIDFADDAIPIVRRAFALARSGRPGPVYIDIPRDILALDCNVPDTYEPVSTLARPNASECILDKAFEALRAARRPIIIAGGGAVASNAFEAVRELAEALAIPVLTSLAGRGIISDEHPLSAGGLGTNRNDLSKQLLRDADVVLGLGTRFEEMETNWRVGFVPAEQACYIQVDIDPGEIGRSVPASIGIAGDIKAVVSSLLTRIKDAGVGLKAGAYATHPRTLDCVKTIQRIEREIDEVASSVESPIHPFRVIRAARAVFPRDTTVAIDVGCLSQHMVGAHPIFRVFEPRSLIVPSSFYGMGFATNALPAASIVYPDRPALGFSGDGSFQMVLPVLPVAAQYKLAVTWVVLNDQALGSIRDIQKYVYKSRFVDTDFEFQPDFATIAKGCGCYGERIEKADDVEAALKRALAANRAGIPAVLDFSVFSARTQGTLDHYVAYGLARD